MHNLRFSLELSTKTFLQKKTQETHTFKYKISLNKLKLKNHIKKI